jgi:hypothetical protein
MGCRHRDPRAIKRSISKQICFGGVLAQYARDIDSIINRLSSAHPQVRVEQLRVSHPGDDAGIWFFKVAGEPNEVQLESFTGMCPFIVGSDTTEAIATARSVQEPVSFLEQLLRL